MAELKPCPFCGGPAALGEMHQNHEDAGGRFIACVNPQCGASTNLRFPLMDEVVPLLIEQWNRRVPADEVQKVAVDIALWFVNGDRPDEFKLKEWAERLEPDAIAAAYLLRATPQREVPPGKWKVDMPDGTYGTIPGDPPGPASVRAVIDGYVYDVEPRTGRLRAASVPRGVTVPAHQGSTASPPAQEQEKGLELE